MDYEMNMSFMRPITSYEAGVEVCLLVCFVCADSAVGKVSVLVLDQHASIYCVNHFFVSSLGHF